MDISNKIGCIVVSMWWFLQCIADWQLQVLSIASFEWCISCCYANSAVQHEFNMQDCIILTQSLHHMDCINHLFDGLVLSFSLAITLWVVGGGRICF